MRSVCDLLDLPQDLSDADGKQSGIGLSPARIARRSLPEHTVLRAWRRPPPRGRRRAEEDHRQRAEGGSQMCDPGVPAHDQTRGGDERRELQEGRAPGKHHGRVQAGIVQDGRRERGGRGFAVASAHGDSVLQPHQLSQQLAARNHRNLQPPRFLHFGVLFIHRRAHHQRARALDISGRVAFEDTGAHPGKPLRNRRQLQVRAGDLIAEVEQQRPPADRLAAPPVPAPNHGTARAHDVRPDPGGVPVDLARGGAAVMDDAITSGLAPG